MLVRGMWWLGCDGVVPYRDCSPGFCPILGFYAKHNFM